MKNLIYLLISIPILLNAQIGIGTTNPNALLDIRSSNEATPTNTDGLLIPKVAEYPTTNPTAAQDGMMIYVTGNGSLTKGFYYWDNAISNWIAVGKATGLEKIIENGQSGWRLAERDNVNHGDIGIGAIDLSYNDGTSSTRGATGEFSLATGKRTTASGIFSTAIGGLTTASGNYATAMGNNSKAASYSQTSLGMYNTTVAGTHDSFVATDRIFVIGNGVNNNNKSDALVVLKNGTITAPSLELTDITNNKSLITKEYANANFDNSNGLVKITEQNDGSGNPLYGWRLKGQNSDNYDDIGDNSVDLSYNSTTSFIRGASGNFSTAMGYKTTASGDYSTAMGSFTVASGDSSTAMGEGTEAHGEYSTAMGSNSIAYGDYSIAMGRGTGADGIYSTTMGYYSGASGDYSTAMGSSSASGDYSIAMGISSASGDYSTAMGNYTTAESYNQTTIGSYNTQVLGNATDFISTDRLFVIGNGTYSDNKSDALIILKNGTITAPSLSVAEIIDNKALVTKEYVDTKIIIGGLEKITENLRTGWRLKGQNPDNYGNIGDKAVDLSYSDSVSTTKGATGLHSTAMGLETTASSYGSTAIGWGTISSNYGSTAMGYNTTASGGYSTAMGLETIASGNQSTATGHETTASGDYSTAMGYETTAIGDYSTAMGRQTYASGMYSTTMGEFTNASGDYSTAMGSSTHATGDYSTAMGSSTASGKYSAAMGSSTASGKYSTAMGSSTTASGDFSTAMGSVTVASGDYSTVMGRRTTAESYRQTTIGSYNTPVVGNATNYIPTDRLFVIGNGATNSYKSDAMVVLKNGNTTINGDFNVNGNFNKVKATDSGNADMKAYIYGLVGSNGGSSVASSDGFTQIRLALGTYKITFNVPMAKTKYIAVATLHDAVGFISLIRHHNYIEVKTYNISGTAADRGFYFVVYKK